METNHTQTPFPQSATVAFSADPLTLLASKSGIKLLDGPQQARCRPATMNEVWNTIFGQIFYSTLRRHLHFIIEMLRRRQKRSKCDTMNQSRKVGHSIHHFQVFITEVCSAQEFAINSKTLSRFFSVAKVVSISIAFSKF